MREFFAKLTLFSVDFFEIKDSIDWEIESNPADDLIFFEAPIINSGIKEVIYKEKYKDNSGIDILQSCGISVRSI